jgi:hypothetical protein
MQLYEIAVVILSCDKFKITWQPCIDHFYNAWPGCPHPVYLLNNLVPSNDNRVIDLMTGQDDGWSDSVIRGLRKIRAKRVFFIFDDSFITHIDINRLNVVFDVATKYDLDSVALLKKKFDRGDRFAGEIFKLSSKSKYRNSLFLNLIKRDTLLAILRAGENAWQYEKVGNKRSEGFDFYSVNSTNFVRYHHGIVKGKWLPETYTYLMSNGYNLDGNPFGVYTKMQVAGLKIYEKAFNAYQKVYHLVNWYWAKL